MVYRIFVEKKKTLAAEAESLYNDAKTLLGIKNLEKVRIANRYDAENLSAELFDYAVTTVFSEPQTDIASKEVNFSGAYVFAVEFLPGQFDQRADSAAQCIQIISQGMRPTVRSAKIYALYGNLTEEEIKEIKKYVINPVEAREASLELPKRLAINYDIPTEVKTMDGFTELSEDGIKKFIADYGLACDADDLAMCRDYFRKEGRDPTITEIKMIDTYWSDHCRHTTFNTIIDSVVFEDDLLNDAFQHYLEVRKSLGRKKPVCLMDIGTIAVKYLKAAGKLDKLDESEEINACTVKITAEINGKKEPWLLLFKNETHNHPTEIEPFGGAATCVGGAIRDPLSGRAYVYGAMRVTGAANPLTPVNETISGKLPQRKLVTTAAAGYSSYGNQIGLATGIVDEIYHPGYAAKRMEVGAVIAAAPAENVRRERPIAGDIIILLGGATGRDGIGGATGSSKAHNIHSVESCGAEVQKGNAPEERKMQRLFRNEEATRLIKRCNDFGAGGVSVAIGELADGLDIHLNAVPKKYEGLDGTELAISESQERMAVVVAAQDADKFMQLAESENLSATKVAVVKEDPRLTMTWNGKKIVDISREFLDTNGAKKHITIAPAPAEYKKKEITGGFTENYLKIASDLNSCSHRGMSQRFDSTVGAGTVLMPTGGKHQITPIQAMAQKLPVMPPFETDDCTLMAWGYNPFITEQSPYHGAYLAVCESVSKLIATGADFSEVYLSFQEYFEKLGRDATRWGKPFAALLGAFEAQLGLGIAAIGGKDSMSGTFEQLNVPPTLISFAVTKQKTDDIISPEFKAAGHKIIRIAPEINAAGLPKAESLIALFEKVTSFIRSGKALACCTPTFGGIAAALMKMSFGNGIGVKFADNFPIEKIFCDDYCSFIIEIIGDADEYEVIGETTDDEVISLANESIALEKLLKVYDSKLESVFPCYAKFDRDTVKNYEYKVNSWQHSPVHVARPKVIIPTFPGTNCEYDSARAVWAAGAEPEIFVVQNLTSDLIAQSVEKFAKKLKQSQMIFIPGGFSGGDEPDGSGKFITAFFRNSAIKDAVADLLDNRGGLICGICNGFQALVKLGLVPFGKIIDMDKTCPTLTFNTIARHQSGIVRTRVASNKSPWLSLSNVGEVYLMPISHGEGRFIASEELIKKLEANGQIATQYVDLEGKASNDIRYNPNNSACAIEGITSPDGRVFGKMGHAERIDKGTYKNVLGNYDIRMFEAAVKYFK